MNSGITVAKLSEIGFLISGTLFLVLAVLLLTRFRSRSHPRAFALASLATSVSLYLFAVYGSSVGNLPWVAVIGELLRNGLWIVALFLVLRNLDSKRSIEKTALPYLIAVSVVVIAIALLAVKRNDTALDNVSSAMIAAGLVSAVLALMLVEQIVRNAVTDSGGGLRYFCLAVAGIYLYDLVLYGHGLLASQISGNAWAARGFVHGMFVVPLAYSLQRGLRFSLDSYIPRQALFYTFVLFAAASAFAILLAGDVYIRNLGGSWAEVARIVFIICGLATFVTLLVSATLRARTVVWLKKTLFQYKYDYRREWLRFIGTLSEPSDVQMPVTAVRAIAQIVNSPGGVAWARQEESQDYVPVGVWRCEMSDVASIRANSSLIEFLEKSQWVIDLNELDEYPERYEDFDLGTAFQTRDDWWLIIPMLQGRELFGLIALLKPSITSTLDFEDHDLLKTVGRHAGTHIDQAESGRRLSESRQFGAYNRLTAFLMHDLNNLIAQQSLVVSNAEKFRDNPAFVEDAIGTIAHSVERMRRLMEQLSSGSKTPVKKRVRINKVLEEVVRRSESRKPVPDLDIRHGDLVVLADSDRLSMVLEHLVRNAQEATADDGKVVINSQADGDHLILTISDTGCGMSPEFIRERLFRPFDSTKGSQSMGIGAYQAREYAKALGGQLDVQSAIGGGSEFTIILPVDPQ